LGAADDSSQRILDLLRPPNLPILLFPEENKNDTVALSLSQAKREIQEIQEKRKTEATPGKIVLLVLDATWKYAREMHRANQTHHQYPAHMLQVSLQAPEDFPDDSSLFRPRRFDIRTIDIRTTPSGENHETWMCTAECIAWALSRLEDNPELYSTIMKPLDSMVEKWNSFVKSPKIRERPLKKQKR
jgi:DTW domain-containing protein YfiP